MACSIRNVVSAMTKLISTMAPKDLETPEGAVIMQDVATKHAHKLTAFLKHSAPLLDVMDCKKLKEAAEHFQTGVVLAKRWAAAPPYHGLRRSLF